MNGLRLRASEIRRWKKFVNIYSETTKSVYRTLLVIEEDAENIYS